MITCAKGAALALAHVVLQAAAMLAAAPGVDDCPNRVAALEQAAVELAAVELVAVEPLAFGATPERQK